MTTGQPPGGARAADFLLPWDRLGFRLAVFGALALSWILQGGALGLPWKNLVKGELMGIMPWAFLAPLVFAWSRFLRSRRPGLARFAAGHTAGMLLLFVPYWIIQRGIDMAWTWGAAGWNGAPIGVWIPTRANLLGALTNVPFAYLLVLLGAEALRHARARREEEIQAERLAGQLSEARLALLQRQLHPHFLFNALQAISTLLHRDPAAADELLVKLSSLLRAMLDDASGHTLTLGVELGLARKYLEIEQARFGRRLSVAWDLDAAPLEVPVPSLVVLPIVENAIRHGLTPKVGDGRLCIGARATDGRVVVTVEDDGAGAALPVRCGVGLANTRARLEAMYGARARLTIETSPGRGFRAAIELPLPGDRP